VESDKMAIIKKKIENLKPGKEYVLTVRAKNSDLNVLSDYSDTIRFQVPNDATTPSALTNLQLFAGLENVMFVFDYSQDLDISRYEYELYENSNMSDEDGPLTGFADANVFTVRVSNLQLEEDYDPDEGLLPFWGRARTIDTTGNAGPWTPLVRTDPHTPLIDNQYIGSLTVSKLTAGTIGAHTINLNGANSIIQSTTYSDTFGLQGWQIKGDGSFSLGGPDGITYDNDSITIGSDVQVQANLAADSISVGSGGNLLNINDSINAGAGGMTLGSGGFNYWYTNGQFRTGNATNFVSWNGNSLTFQGTIQAGTIGGVAISSNAIYIGTGAFNNVNTGFYVDNTSQFSLGNKLTWGNLTTAGNFIVGKSYKIVSLTGTTQAQWNTAAGTTGSTYIVGSVFTAAAVGAGTGTAALQQLTIAGDVVIGSTTGSTIASGAASGSTSLQPGQAASDINSNITTISGGKIRTGTIESTGYTYSTGNFSTAGMQINLDNGVIRSKNFGIDSSGNAFFNGQITASSGSIGGWSIGDPGGYNGSIYAGSGPTLSFISPTGVAWFSGGVVTSSINGFGGGVTTSSGALNTMILRNIRAGASNARPSTGAIGDIYLSY